jgi:tripartite-type tricarboxylate transporter receptor subunit TctC
MIVPFAAGGPSDTLARMTAEHLGRTLGQQVIVENVGGAGGTLGAERAARATADGYTILQHHGALAVSPALYPKLKINVRTAFEPAGLINTGPMLLNSRKTLAPRTAQELVAYARSQGDKLTLAHAGVGSNSYMCGLLFMQILGTQPSLVPYRGTGPAMNDLVGGQIDVLCDQALTATPQVQAGNIRAYAVTSASRLPAVKDVPTYKEAGLEGFDIVIWNALYAPKGTPRPIVQKLNAAVQKFVTDPIVLKRFADTGYSVFPPDRRSPEAHAKFFLSEVDRYAAMIKAVGPKSVPTK